MNEYIERERLLRRFNIDDMMNVNGTLISLKDARNTISNFPAADVAPVVHGKWVQVIVHIEFEDGFVDRVEECCSACHESNERRCTYFCPNCGAKMDDDDNA